MELPSHGRPTSAADDGRPRRFPDPPPTPHARDADALQRDAALLRRRDELLWELDTVQTRLNLVVRELVETQYAMAVRSAPAHQWPLPTGPWPWSQDRWHRWASSATTWEDAPPRQPSTCPEHLPCPCRSPAAVRPVPAYPHVERSPSPIAMSGYLDRRRLPSKQTRTEEALLPGVANAGVRPIGSKFVRQEVTPELKDAVVKERKADLEDGNGQNKVAETSVVDFINEPGWHSCRYRPAGLDHLAFKEQKPLEFSQSRPGSDTKQQQECQSSGATVCQPPSKQLNARRNRWDIGMEHKVDVENGHDQINGPMQSPRGYIPEGQGNAAYSEQKRIEIREPRSGIDAKQQQECRSSGATVHLMSGYLELRSSPRNQTLVEETMVPSSASAISRPTAPMSIGDEVATVNEQEIGEKTKVDAKDEHGVQLYRNRSQSSCQRQAVEPAMGAQSDKPLQLPSQSKLAGQESAAYNEQKRIEISEVTPERTSSGLKRRLTAATPLAKKQKPLAESSRTLNPNRWNIEARPASIKPVRWDDEENVAENSGSEGWTEPAASRWTCGICDAHCYSASILQQHLGGRRHRGNTEAILAEFRCSYSRMNADSNSAYYCEVCSVRCSDETDMASHLIGRRHQETLRGLE